jgi:hypothetical protein
MLPLGVISILVLGVEGVVAGPLCLGRRVHILPPFLPAALAYSDTPVSL